MATLTSRTLATGVTSTDLIHIVITGDTSQSPDGSSYKATIGQVLDLFSASTNTYVTGGTYDNNTGTATFTNNQGSEFDVTGFYTGGTDIYVTGGNYDNNTGTATFTNTTGGTFDVTGFYTGLSNTNIGLFSQTGDSMVVSGTTEQSIINGGVGTLSVGPNQFQVGDSFAVNINGHLSNNNDNFTMRVESGSVVLADSGPIGFNTSGDDEIFSLQINFTIQQIGSAGVAKIFTKGILTSIKISNYSTKGFSFEYINNTTFDTTITNNLDITFQFDASDPQTYVYTDFLVINKIF